MKNQFVDKKLSQEELLLKAISEIIKEFQIINPKDGKTARITIFNILKKFRIEKPPKIVELLSILPNEIKNKISKILKINPIRTVSGIAIIAVMAKPHRCPHIYITGNVCAYCPGGPDSDFEYSNQAYTGYEPTSRRAIKYRYDPYLQIKEKIKILESCGHNTDKIELVILGGTFLSLPAQYRCKFISKMHDAISGHNSPNLEESIIYSEKSLNNRCVGLTIETRPDYCQSKHVQELLSYGCTRIEIGIQSIYEDVALDTNRGHTVSAACDSLVTAKNYGYKITGHMMPDLPNVGVERDIYQFDEFFKNPEFRVDGLKIYPTLVIRGTGLYELWNTKRYQNYPASTLIDLMAHVMTLIPPWVRVYRIQREIPMAMTSSSGVSQSHLRQLIEERMIDLGLESSDIRGREIGIKISKNDIFPEEIHLIRRDYFANEDWETFLSYEDPKNKILIGLLRLRKCPRNPFTKIKHWSVVRELHVYGSVVGVSERDSLLYQHQGIGKLLLEEAERISCQEHNSHEIAVISGVGVRNYYKKHGYYLENHYMVKKLG